MRPTVKWLRRAGWAAALLIVLGLALYAGGQLGWRLHAAADKRGCVPLPADLMRLEPATGQTGRVRFAALGDTGTGSAGQHKVAEALRRVCADGGCDFVLLLGDNIYPDGVSGPDDPLFRSAFEDVYANLGLPVYPALGNHDVHQPAIYEVFHTRESRLWRMPNYEYGFTAGPARFFAVNTNCPPVTWWRLADRLRQPFSGWTIVWGHHPIYAVGVHGDGPWAVRHLWDGLREGVDFYLAGHNHLLQHLQRPGERTDYVVSGAGGAELTDPADERGPSAAEQRFKAYVPGFAWLELTAAQATLRLYDDNAQVIYEAVRKGPGRP